MPNTQTTTVKKFTTMQEFFQDPQFKIFEKNSLAKLVEIVNAFELWPNPTVEDFGMGYSYGQEDEHRDGFDLSTVNLAERQSVKLVSGLVLNNFGPIRINYYMPEGCEDENAVQLVTFNAHWSFKHYGGGENGSPLFSASFDLNGKLASLHMQYVTKELEAEQKQLAHLEIHGTGFEQDCAKESHKKARAVFMKQVEALIDQDNLLKALQNQHQQPTRER